MQQYMAIGALILLSTVALNFYRTSSNQTTVSYANESMIAATALGQSLIEEIKGKAFDENTVAAPCTLTTNLTLATNLGPETGETLNTQFDDIDDYNNYTRTVSTARLGNYYLRARVAYVDPLYPESTTTTRTFIKRVDVFVLNSYLVSASDQQDTLKLNAIIAY